MTTLTPIKPTVPSFNSSNLSPIKLNSSTISADTKKSLTPFDSDKNGVLTFNEFTNSNMFAFDATEESKFQKFTTFKNAVTIDPQAQQAAVDDLNTEKKLSQKKTDLLHIKRHGLNMDLRNSRLELEEAVASQKKLPQNNVEQKNASLQIANLSKAFAQNKGHLEAFQSEHSSLDEPSFFLLKLLNVQARTSTTEPNYANLASIIDGIEVASYGDHP
ncbi:MAG: hypothetical protein LW809_00330 [Vampirovibrionales bacterium]|jgi:hypothetical protein|nr:hypothetical protein [Vampirovibrionales bacterium]